MKQYMEYQKEKECHQINENLFGDKKINNSFSEVKALIKFLDKDFKNFFKKPERELKKNILNDIKHIIDRMKKIENEMKKYDMKKIEDETKMFDQLRRK